MGMYEILMNPTEAASVQRIARASHTTLVIRAMILVAATGHGVILVAVSIVGLRPLILFNIGSLLVYSLALVAARKGRISLAFVLGAAEVIAHSWFATVVIGFASGFHIYTLALVPLIISFEPWRMPLRIVGALLVTANYVALAVTGELLLGAPSTIYVHVFRYGNFATAAVVLAAFSYYYTTAIGRAQTALIEQNTHLDRLSREDQLTGLPNRRHGLDRLSHEQYRTERSDSVASVCMADIDHFKVVNDRWGHDAGDAVLVAVARGIRGCLRRQDTVARWGGEEFLILLPDTDTRGGVIAMEKVRRAVEAMVVACSGARISVSLSVGVAQLTPRDGVEQAIQDADAALYRSKESGRNRVHAHTKQEGD